MARPVELAKSSRFIVLAAICIVVGALYFAQEVLIPLALAVLFCFLLAPLVTRLERLRLGRVPAVIVVVLAATSVVVALAWVTTVQLLNLADNLPTYRVEIVDKMQRAKSKLGGGGENSLGNKIADFTNEVKKASTQPASQPAATQPGATQPATQPGTTGGDSDAADQGAAAASNTGSGATGPAAEVPDAVEQIGRNPIGALAREATGEKSETAAPLGTTKTNPVWVVALQEPASPVGTLGSYLGVVLSPLGTAGLVLVFVIFMLIQREDLRDRLLRLIGRGRLNVSTAALDDAATRISRYMLAQAIVNGSYGIAVAIGLWTIGYTVGDKPFPSFVLWGLLCAVLRFIPYIGPWVAASFPIVLSLAVYHGFGVFVWVTGMFVVIELFSNNVMEPWLYGTSTGMSTIAVLVSAVFWTWLWGPVGLLLATPLTVCLVVLGKYVPQLQFLDILLGDEPVLDPPARVYQRLLALDQEEAADLAREFLKESSIEQVFDEVFVPALGMAEQDRHRGRLDEERSKFVRQSMRQLVEELSEEYQAAGVRSDQPLAETLKEAAAETVAAAKSLATKITSLAEGNGNGSGGGGGGQHSPDGAPVSRAVIPKSCKVNVVCLPAHDDADDIVALMLKQLLELQGYCAHAPSVTSLASEMVEAVEKHDAHAVVVSAMPPGAVSYSRYLCKRLHARFPDLNMVVGLWTMRGNLDKARERVTCSGSVRLVTTLRDAMDEVNQMVQPVLVRARNEEATEASDAAEVAVTARPTT